MKGIFVIINQAITRSTGVATLAILALTACGDDADQNADSSDNGNATATEAADVGTETNGSAYIFSPNITFEELHVENDVMILEWEYEVERDYRDSSSEGVQIATLYDYTLSAYSDGGAVRDR